MARKSQSTNVSINMGSGSVDMASYAPIEAGIYYGVINFLTIDKYRTRSGKTMEKFVPSVTLFNSVGTIIDMQGLTIGAVNNSGEYYRLDGDRTKSPIFSGADAVTDQYGAMYFMTTLGMLSSDGTYDFDEEAILDVAVKVKVEQSSYVSKTGEERRKNVITSWFSVNLDDVPEHIDTTDWVQHQHQIGSDTVTLTFTNDSARQYFINTMAGEVVEDNSFWSEPNMEL